MVFDIAVGLCQEFEGFFPQPYLCPAGVPTIGYGTTRYPNGKVITLQDHPIAKDQAVGYMLDEIERVCYPGVLRLCPVLIQYPNALNAIIDFTYNLGVGRLQTSTLRRRINDKDWSAARYELSRWTRGGGRVLPGLVRRRAAEAKFLEM